MFLEIDAAEAGDELRVFGREGDGALKRGDGVIEMFLRDLDIGAEAQRVGAGWLVFVGAIELGKGFVVILLLDEKMYDAGANGLIVWLEHKIFAIGVGGLGLPFRVERLRETKSGDGGVRIGVDEGAKFRFGVGGALEFEIQVREVKGGFGVSRVEIDGTLEGIRGTGEVAGALLRYTEKNSWA